MQCFMSTGHHKNIGLRCSNTRIDCRKISCNPHRSIHHKLQHTHFFLQLKCVVVSVCIHECTPQCVTVCVGHTHTPHLGFIVGRWRRFFRGLLFASLLIKFLKISSIVMVYSKFCIRSKYRIEWQADAWKCLNYFSLLLFAAFLMKILRSQLYSRGT